MDNHHASYGGAKAKTTRAKRPLTRYNKFVKACSAEPMAKTRSGQHMMKYCAAKWEKLSESEKNAYK